MILTVAIALPVLMGAVGTAIDYAHVLSIRERAQGAADASVLHLAKYLALNKLQSVSPKKRDEVASRIFKAELGDDVSTVFSVVAKKESDTRVTTLTADSTVDTMFLRVIGIPKVHVVVNASAQFDLKTFAVEIGFVLNIGASMDTERKKQALAAALDAVMTQFQAVNKTSKDRVRVTIVPFQLGVTVPSVDSSNFKWSLLAKTAPSNCVTDRAPPYAHNHTPVTSWLSLTKHPVEDADKVPAICPTSAIIPVTTDLDAVRAALPTPGTVDGTNGAIGLAWGWNMLTPGTPGSNSGKIPLGKDQATLKRVLIYLTDGENTGNTLGFPATTVDDWSLLLCTGIKLAGITVVTINIDGDGSESFLRACASSSEKYKKVPAPDLPQVLEEMTQEVTGMTPIRLIR